MPTKGRASGGTISRIVSLRQMLRRWRARASCRNGDTVAPVPPDVPAGHVAVCVVGSRSTRRFVVRLAHLNHPLFRKLLLRAEEEYGFDHAGPLAIPCDEDAFEELLKRVSAGTGTEDRNCHAAWQCQQQQDSRPLLRGLAAGEWGSSSIW